MQNCFLTGENSSKRSSFLWHRVAPIVGTVLMMVQTGYGQMNISGKPGLMYIPTSVSPRDGTLSIGGSYNPETYSFRRNGDFSENIYFVNLTFIPRLEVNLTLTRSNGVRRIAAIRDRSGIGDRQLDVKYQVLTERDNRPSVALVVSAPFGVNNFFNSNALVAGKTWKVSEKVNLELTAGMGSPYYLLRKMNPDGSNTSLFSAIKVRKKSELPYRYLSGPFGGLNIRYKNIGGGMVEWDSQRLNMGVYTTLFKKWTVQAAILNFDQVSFGTSYTLNLKDLPKQLRHD
jgi:hypothetical protein